MFQTRFWNIWIVSFVFKQTLPELELDSPATASRGIKLYVSTLIPQLFHTDPDITRGKGTGEEIPSEAGPG